ncbi:hypothetical protein Tco_0862161 [Tanacetum coccineum]
MTGGLLRGTPGDNIGATPTGITGNISGSTSGGPLEINVETLLNGAVPSAREQIEGHLSALRSLLKERNRRGNVSPIGLSFDDTEDQSRVQTVVTGTVVDADLKKPFKEAVKTPLTRRIIEFAGPEFKMPANIRFRGCVRRATRYRGSYRGRSGPNSVHISGASLENMLPNIASKTRAPAEVAVEEHTDRSSRLRRGSGKALGKN